MAFKAQQATGCEQVTAPADRGYFNGDQVLSCEGTGVAPVVPKTLTPGNAKRGLFTGQDFIYDAEKDHYSCPAGAAQTRQAIQPILAESMTCSTAVYQSPEAAPLRVHLPYNPKDATPAQLSDRAFATESEIAALQGAHQRLG